MDGSTPHLRFLARRTDQEQSPLSLSLSFDTQVMRPRHQNLAKECTSAEDSGSRNNNW